MKTLVFALSIAAVVSAADLGSQTRLRGEYVEARTADIYTGPCFANSEVELTGNLAVLGWKIEKGSWEGVPLDGLSVVGVVHSESTLGDFMHPDAVGARAVLIVDEKASAEQRLALAQFARKMGAGLLNDVVRTEARGIAFSTGDMHSREAKLVAGELAKVETRALAETDKICHNEEVWYKPLTQLDHAMAAYTVEQSYQGKGLDTTWSYPGKRSAYVGTFQYQQ
ncbi:MAG TPA: DUF1326 domain-containing protein [Bryobacteraceae bacterium]|nr:DUF1326 domain-containing protein [Bryobacteraceae bacterium]